MARKISAAGFVAFLNERLAARDGYIFGAVGQDPRRMPDWYFTGQYSGKQLKQALYWREHARRVWDCNGLAEGYYRDVTGVDIDARARDNYRSWCAPKGEGMIPAARRVPGAAVFKRSSYIHHVGFLVAPVEVGRPGGDWYVIEAKGVMTGVIRSRLSENDWNCWGWMTKYFDYGEVNNDDAAPEAGPRLLKRGMRGEDVQELQENLIALGYALPRYGADGQYGAETEAAVRRFQESVALAADGIFGPATRAAMAGELESAGLHGDPGDDSERLRVTAQRAAYVRTGPGTAYPARTTVHRGDEFDVLAVAGNGWRSIRAEGQVGWISPRMCEVIEDG